MPSSDNVLEWQSRRRIPQRVGQTTPWSIQVIRYQLSYESIQPYHQKWALGRQRNRRVRICYQRLTANVRLNKRGRRLDLRWLSGWIPGHVHRWDHDRPGEAADQWLSAWQDLNHTPFAQWFLWPLHQSTTHHRTSHIRHWDEEEDWGVIDQ